MRIVKTKSFELAIITEGDENADKVALVLPGRLDTKDYSVFSSHLKLLASKGFFAVSFDPPGTWDSKGGIDLFTTTNYIKAVNELIEYFGNKPTFLMGHSRGGTVAILAGSMNTNVIGLAPIMATYGEATPADEKSLKTGIKVTYRDLPPGTSKTAEQKIFALPINYFEDAKKYNVTDYLEKFTKPKLVLYGKNDSFTKPEEVERVFATLPEPKAIHLLNTGHDYRYNPEIIEEVNVALGQFVDKYFK